MEKNIQKCSKKILWLVCLAMMAMVVLYCILAYNFYQRGMYYMLVAQTVLLVFHIVILGQCMKKTLNIKIIMLQYLGYLLVCIILNITFFYKGSFLTPDLYMGNQEYDTIYEYYEKKFINVNEKMAFTDYRALSLSIFYDFFKDKEVIVDDLIVDDEIVYYLISGLNGNYLLQNVKRIEEEQILTLKTEYPKQTLSFYTDRTELSEKKKLYLFTGEEWNSSEKIYIFECEGMIYAVPNELLQNETVVWDESEREKPLVNDIIIECRYVSWKGEIDASILQYSQVNETSYRIAIHNLTYVLYIFLIGLIALFPLFRKINNTLVIFLSYPLGTILHILSVMIVGSLGIRINLLSVILAAGGISVLYNLLLFRIICKMKNRNVRKKELLLGGICSIIISIYFSFNVNVWMSYDSFMSIYLAKYIVYNGEFKSILETLSSFSLGTPIINTGAVLFGIDLNYAFQPIMTFMGIGAITILSEMVLTERYAEKKKNIIGIVVIALLLFISTPMFGQSKEWMHNNMTIGVWFGISITFLVWYCLRQEKILLILAFPYLLAASIVRIEGPLFATILLVCLKRLLQSKRVIKGISCGVLGCSLLQFILYYRVIGFVDSKFWTPIKGIAMLSVLTMYVIYLFTEEYLPVFCRKISNNIDRVMLVVLVLVAIILSMFNYRLAVSNVIVLAQLFLGMGYYGSFVFCVIITIIIDLRLNIGVDKLVKFYYTFFVGFILGIYNLVFFRKPLHNNSGDSACRMLLHISFVGCIFIAVSFFEIYKASKLQKLEEK